eukprot:CAMPEP_0184438496 /NCGR_PEP_ID=MMETSP0738-20130409/654400_1 /TAXON_ID=385413 /ORGANISM="Thalassiosira miniscula, Strain CCMP1093" /LENGTH=54 /DNA_ID=CAMNT_0026805843 /DNA_START=359 /DNA_END=520 /DNA_ORIENTATION=-
MPFRAVPTKTAATPPNFFTTAVCAETAIHEMRMYAIILMMNVYLISPPVSKFLY